MLNYTQRGERLEWTNSTSTAVAASGIVWLTDRIAVALNAIAVGASDTLNLVGVHTLTATAAETWTVGQQLYYNSATGAITNVAGANPAAGYAFAAKAALATTGSVKINA